MDLDRRLRWIRILSPVLPALAIVLTPLLNLYARITRPQYYRYANLAKWARAAYWRGDYDAAEKDARELLALAEAMARVRRDWNYGNAIHDGNQMLGLVSLARGDVEAAKEYLLAAGRSPGSPQLDSYGPRMTLARKLLEVGERETVLAYLDGVASFMTTLMPELAGHAAFQYSVREHRESLARWRKDIRAGRIPDDDNWNAE